MSNEEKKEYLKSYWRAKKEESALEEAIAELRSNRISLAVREPDWLSGKGGSDGFSGYAARLDEVERELQIKKRKAVDQYHRVMSDILAVPDETERRLLQYRYVKVYTWEQVATEMGYSWQWVHKLHVKALKKFKEAIESDI